VSARRDVVIVTFHFPPQRGAGSLRLLSFARHLPELGWRPRIVTVGDLGAGDPSLIDRIPADAEVERWFTPLASWAYGKGSAEESASRRLARSFVRRVLEPATAYPDPALLWSLATGWRLAWRLRKDPPNVFMTSSPPHSLHAVGLVASGIADVPWVMDLRDPWESNLPFGVSRLRQAAGSFLEGNALSRAACVLANTARLARDLESRPRPPRRVVVLPNGYDEDEIRRARAEERRAGEAITIVHAGALYAGQRDPLDFLEALAQARQETGRRVRFILPGESSFHRNPAFAERIRALGLDGVVECPGYLPHTQVLSMMASADLLLLIQGKGFHLQVPSKAYEYLALGPPVLALTSEGATADLVRGSPVGCVVHPTDRPGIVRALTEAFGSQRRVDRPSPPPGVFSRQQITARLAATLEETSGTEHVY